jgi:single-strand DNA-binding protein
MDLNKVILVGRVTADPQMRSTPGGQSVTTIGVATNRTWTDKAGQKQEQTEFHNVVLWGRTAEIAGQYLTKGAMVLIEGRLQTRSWTDKNGQQRKTTEVMAERMQLGPRSANAVGGGGGSWQGGSKSSGSDAPSASSPTRDSGDKDAVPSLDEIPVINLEEDEIKPEDIPF